LKRISSGIRIKLHVPYGQMRHMAARAELRHVPNGELNV